ncbi:amidohydrolase family protein [Neobacillus sp. OS1-2]|uniref:amidohydrolase family protein n=1 Tax=Neobacillus sp. OS1-2 TaxID=3070680 RepID=UPI0027E0793A|nr:amidohydrolase family protein [Neobacillus sp. OS1-2]WML39729.1 amidohydrolase family protein [Neobacillus sp. OS1-2]
MNKITYFDSNIYIGNWPFHQLRYNNLDGIFHLMKKVNIEKGIISSLDSVFCIDRDLPEVNRKLYEQVREHPEKLLPFYTINPNVYDCSEYIDQLVKEYNSYGFRLYPTYHDYSLLSKAVDSVAVKASEYKIPIFVTYRFEDERVHHPNAKVPTANTEELAQFFNKHPDTTFIMGGMRITDAEELFNLLSYPNVYFELSFIQTPFRSLELLIEKVGVDRVLFGTGLPYWYPECTTLKLETSILSEENIRKIARDNLQMIIDQRMR